MLRHTRNILLLLIASHSLLAQSNGVHPSSDSGRTLNKKRLTGLIVGSTVAYGAALYGLNELWYSHNPKQSFSFFNDNAEWKQVDKVGHFYSAFYISYGSDAALRWAGVKDRKAAFIGSLVGFGVMLPIEIMDGYSAAYGASVGDLAANAAGAALYLGQTLLWKDLRIYPKFSFHQTDYASLRPNVLGDNAVSEMFKDYNGQTYWLSVDMDKFVRFPKWLNLAVGYGADGMVYARDEQNIEAQIGPPYRQYYLAIDFDLRAIHTRSKFLRGVIEVVSLIRLPAPAIQFSEKGVKAYAFYF
ncbi:MAG TPA: DUF2279 domain-containing protein [Chryseolinea sp.]|nr:DUF2279 domain-containing protein [Chryseolinea sp.]